MFEEHDRTIAATGKGLRVEQQVEVRGEKRWVEAVINPILDATGAVTGTVGIFRDFTARRVSEAVLRENARLLDTAQRLAGMVSVEWDVAADKLVWSRSPEFLLGPRPDDGYPLFREMVHPEDRKQWLAVRQHALESGQEQTLTFRIVRTDGGVRWVECVEQLEPEDGGAARRMVHTFVNITERRHAELALAVVNLELEAFSYTVSHDLRAPVRAVAGFSGILLKDHAGGLNGEARRLLERISTAGVRMGEMIDGMLALAQVKRTSLRAQTLDLSAIARSAWEDILSTEPARSVAFKVAEGLAARGDAVLVRSVLQNLLGNAFKYSRRMQGAAVEFGSSEQDGETVFFVRDNGAGFDMAYADKLFGVFQRLHAHGEFEGSGIGLATVQRIIQRHGGRIWAEAKPDQGATFYFTLPGRQD